MRTVCALLLFGAACLSAADFRSNFPAKVERPWIGPNYWANPMQDWRLRDGRIECWVAGGDRNVYLLTRDVSQRSGDLKMSVRIGRLANDRGEMQMGFVGFRLGVRGDFKDYRDSAVRGEGLNAGITTRGALFIGNVRQDAVTLSGPFDDLELRLTATPTGQDYTVRLEAYTSDGKRVMEVTRQDIPAEALTGGVALVCHNGPIERTPPRRSGVVDPGWAGKRYTERTGDVRFWFRDWTVSGSKVDAFEDRAWGPILWSMHTLNRGVLKLTAQMAPVESAAGGVTLERKAGAQWIAVGKSQIDPLSRTATFRIPKWNDKVNNPYRVVFRHDGKLHTFEGIIRRDPVDKPQIVVAAFTGNNDLGFPHNDIVKHVKVHKPDFLVYTGDQIYERVAEYGIQRAPLEQAALDYLRKWYQLGWEYRDLLRDTPAVCLPDDHDVYHGNIWGAGGRKADGEGQAGQDSGGYTMPAEWVNMVQRTQTSHMADPYDPTPVQQGITVYYGPMLYGGVSFAVIEDRKWKSAPKVMLPNAKIVNGWPQNPAYDGARDGDAPGAELLGKRQIEFLNKWAQDWNGAWMKSLISQTIFATVATLPNDMKSDAGVPKLRITQPGDYPAGDVPTMDHDSNGWPQTPRKEALRAMRRGVAFHIAGDQHLASTVQYGIDDWRDASYAICVPSVANVFPRRWFPPVAGKNQKAGAPKYTGDFLDGFGNKISVEAVANPTSVPVEPKALYDRAPGYGIIKFDRATRKIEMANWPRWVDPAAPGSKPYDGWPITIDQTDNGLPNRGWSLAPVKSATADPVVQVVDESNGEPVYTLRIKGRTFTPPVWADGSYAIKVNGVVAAKNAKPKQVKQ